MSNIRRGSINVAIHLIYSNYGYKYLKTHNKLKMGCLKYILRECIAILSHKTEIII